MRNQRFKGTIKSALHHQKLVLRWTKIIDSLEPWVWIIGGAVIIRVLTPFIVGCIHDMWERYTMIQ